MSYTPTTWKTGDVVSSLKLNKLENGVAAAATTNDLDEVKNDLSAITGVTPFRLTTGGYIYTAAFVGQTITDLTPRASASFAYALIDASAGDIFIINGTGVSNAYLWTFIDSDNVVLSKADVNAVGDNLLITAPANSAKLILNSSVAGMGTCYKGNTISNRISAVDVVGNGKQHRIIAGAIRNAGSGWNFIVDQNHQADLNCIGVGIADDGRLYIDYSGLNVSKVISAVFAPDEAMANLGYIMGASVGKDKAYVQIYQYSMDAVAAGFAFDGSGNMTITNVDNGPVTAEWNTNNRLVISHKSMGSITPGGGTPYLMLTPRMYAQYIPRLYSYGGSSTTIEFFDPQSGTKVTALSNKVDFNFARIGSLLTRNEIDPATINMPAGNIWFFGIFEI